MNSSQPLCQLSLYRFRLQIYQPAGRHGRLTASDFCPHTLQFIKTATPAKDWLPLIFTVLPAIRLFIVYFLNMCEKTNFPFSYSYEMLSYTVFWTFTGNQIFSLSKTRRTRHFPSALWLPATGVLDYSPTWKGLLFWRQHFCFHLHLYGKALHLEQFYCFFLIKFTFYQRAMTEVSLLLIPRCRRSNLRSLEVYVSQIPGNIYSLSCIMVERSSSPVDVFIIS